MAVWAPRRLEKFIARAPFLAATEVDDNERQRSRMGDGIVESLIVCLWWWWLHYFSQGTRRPATSSTIELMVVWWCMVCGCVGL